MTLIPGSPILDVQDPAAAIRSLAQATRAMQAIPLTEPLASLERVDSINHYIARLTHTWPGQLADATDDPHTADMLALLRRWEHSGDTATLSRPAPAVYSRGDANLLNWHHDGHHAYVVDFEYSGHSDIAVDAADHIEHISVRAIPDHIWTNTETDLGITPANRDRFNAAQCTIALRWLAVLWKQRHNRAPSSPPNTSGSVPCSAEHTGWQWGECMQGVEGLDLPDRPRPTKIYIRKKG